MPTRDKAPAALDELGKALERFTKQSDRDTALITAAWLDDSLADFLAELAAIQGCTWPLRAAPVLRREGTLTCIDLVAASECLESLLQASIGDGRIPNIRAQHFELLTQDPINQSSWKPTAEVEKLCGRTVRLRGEAHMDKPVCSADCRFTYHRGDGYPESIPYQRRYSRQNCRRGYVALHPAIEF